MHVVQLVVVALAIALGASFTFYFLWNRRFWHVWPKLRDIRIVNPGGLVPAVVEVVFQTRTIANRPVTGVIHLALLYGFVLFTVPAGYHVAHGVMRDPFELPGWYLQILDVTAICVLAAVIYMAIRRAVKWHSFTHQGEGYLVLALLFFLEGSYLVDRLAEHHLADEVAWWVHFAILCTYPIVIAWGMQLHRAMGAVNVALRRMTEVPSDRPVAGADFDVSLMEAEPESEEEEAELDRKMQAEYARVGMPHGLIDMSVHPLLDTTACVECGRCNDVCAGREGGLRPRDHLVLPLRDRVLLGELVDRDEEDEGPSPAERFAAFLDPAILATCTQCRACDEVCPVGNRPSLTALELRGRLHFEGEYPPVPMKEGGANPVSGAGNIFGEDPENRAKFLEDNSIPIYDPEEHEVLFVLGCQGSYHPDVQSAVVATARLLEAAGVEYGVLEDEMCWGEGLLHGGGMMEDWPFYYQDRIEFLTEALGGDQGRTILTICPHCRDTIGTQYGQLGADFSGVVSHVAFLSDLVAKGRLELVPKADTLAIHHPCKLIHCDEAKAMTSLMTRAGVSVRTAGGSPRVPACCGGGGGGFLWDSPAKTNRQRWDELIDQTGQSRVVTACAGCHRMLAVVKGEGQEILDVANVLHERLAIPAEGEAGADG